MSPFGAGGINCYAYCDGDPINISDPSGHMSAQAGVGIGLGVLGMVLGIAVPGASIAVVTGLAAIATGIASAATENSDPEASAALGRASLGLGIAGRLTGLVQMGAGRVPAKGRRKGNKIDFLLGDSQGKSLNPQLVKMEPGIVRENIMGGNSSFYRYASTPNNESAIFVSHGRFQPTRYLNGTARVEIPDGININYYVRHGETISSGNTVKTYSRLQNLSSGGGLAGILYKAPRQIKNYTLNPISEDMSLFIGEHTNRYAHDLIVPVAQTNTGDLFSLLGNHNYKTVHILGCRAYRLTANGI
ncbi:Uncharacterised protein [Serratia quinivorans]|jgi:hypothetical protein|uniref:Adhesin n=1 Tax=Serratia quinivorans TaxID=137545 RepID=A0ABV3UIT3_9GAMM|nr:hypothetical protein [Serratia quinivorans]CAI1565315.1 Uncharacterised protein [Serratia quinivorans]CAI1697995.1 Uncharacterised protein [Serratia quinivorans]CAI1722576.1 Uncharacterised protein [Serratia quinivorans]